MPQTSPCVVPSTLHLNSWVTGGPSAEEELAITRRSLPGHTDARGVCFRAEATADSKTDMKAQIGRLALKD
jgi:hypothetical protein